MTAVRVLHVAGRTPYARKLHDANIRIINGTTVDGLEIPRDVTLDWVLAHRPWELLDAVHMHHPDFDTVEHLRLAMSECRRAGKRSIFTVHDLDPIFGSRVSHQRRLRALAKCCAQLVCLTHEANENVRRRFGTNTVMAPHGYVSAPGTFERRPDREFGAPTRFLVYGSLRQNRDVELLVATWRYARNLKDTTLHLLLRAPSRASLVEDRDAWRAIREHSADPRLSVDVLPFPNDADVNEAVAASDCLVLPYRWASHSGQLEHAFDLGVLPVASLTGYLAEQVALHDGLAPEPVWFDWTATSPFAHGAELLRALQTAHAMIQNGWRAEYADKFADHRRREHLDIMGIHHAVYESVR
ncbi:hypothetical protein ACWFRF_10095 [Nocardia sp. NPDC055165]|uniref:hypothetical protein n=1 Tax=Nocardia sp. NPDC060220 TaxID=3347076 RepID=UPI00366176B7